MNTRSESYGSVRIFWPPYSRAELIELLRGRMPALNTALPLRRVTLFGSWAKGRATAFSDVDLLVVYSAPARDDAYGAVLRCVDVRGLEPHVYVETDAEKMQRTLERMTRGGVELFPVSADPNAE